MFHVQVIAKESPRALNIPEMDKNDAEKTYRELVQSTELLTAGEAIDSVAQTAYFCLCSKCLAEWIENPVSNVAG